MNAFLLALFIGAAFLLLVLFSRKQLLGLAMVLLAGVPIGIMVAFFDSDLGIKISVYCALYFAIMWLCLALSGFFVAFVVAPLTALWFGIKALFGKLP